MATRYTVLARPLSIQRAEQRELAPRNHARTVHAGEGVHLHRILSDGDASEAEAGVANRAALVERYGRRRVHEMGERPGLDVAVAAGLRVSHSPPASWLSVPDPRLESIAIRRPLFCIC